MQTKQQKIASIATSMETKKRNDDTTYTCFTDTCPKALKDIFMDNLEIKNRDYDIFSTALDILAEVYDENELQEDELIIDAIYNGTNDCASVYNTDRLAYLDIHNDSEIAELLINYKCDTISTACAIWYNEQVQSVALLINEWIQTND